VCVHHNQSINQSINQSLTHSLTHCLTHCLTHSLTHSLTQTLQFSFSLAQRVVTFCYCTVTVKGKTIPLQALRGSAGWGFQISWQLAHEGGKVVSPMHQPPLPPGNIAGTHFCWRLSQPQGHSAAGRIMSLKNSSNTIGNQTRNLPVCSAVSQPNAPLHNLHRYCTSQKIMLL